MPAGGAWSSEERQMLDEASRREAFPTLEGQTYLNTAAEGISPLVVGEALAEYFRHKQCGAAGREAHMGQWEAARAPTGEVGRAVAGARLAGGARARGGGAAGREAHMEQWEAARALTAELCGLAPEEVGICS